MEDLSPQEVAAKDIGWCSAKYLELTGLVLGGLFDDEVFDDAETTFGAFYAALQARITELGGTVIPFRDVIIPENV
ncbi:MAG TPA: hypothetical protein P5080_05870 [Candidatus Paceibacterota bacterium]|nr:hypothetical protein [Candidatus Pacearchaeota archaeon]HRZ51464.1 hypothetical protein [Candidatus Paceibacterota bacterium]HSA37194.1 hypothetical protein [Candidatus Paceibacterota bacterium]